MSPYIFALASNFSFGLGSQIFTKFSRKVSPLWMTAFKDSAGCILFLITALILGGFTIIPLKYLSAFFLSGIVGLALGDLMLLNSFAKMGPGRTMMIYSFQPLYLGVSSYFLFGQTIDKTKFLSIIFFVICLFIFALESYKKSGHWNVKTMLIALCAVTMDGTGVLLSRYAFDGTGISVIEGNFYRSLASIFAFAIILNVFKIKFFAKLKRMTMKTKLLAFSGAVLGVYLALVFYLSAVKTGNLAAVSSVSITSALFASIFECIFTKKLPSKYLIISFIFFIIGMYLLLGS
ncbi:drug/metabolite transporter (DMT)-like permease [Elusimicrobium posterum]|uniref:EamA family transporter n=1 Tax=Elusimicrobium posterum TaxID=3116653 RepID=UPI003C74BDBB